MRSFLYSRVDRQLSAARRLADRVLGFAQSGGGTIDAGLLRGVAPDTFIEVRDPSNHVVALSQAGFRGQLDPAPSLPAVLHPAAAASSGFPFSTAVSRFDAGAVSGSGNYRVLVSSLGNNGGFCSPASMSSDHWRATMSI